MYRLSIEKECQMIPCKRETIGEQKTNLEFWLSHGEGTERLFNVKFVYFSRENVAKPKADLR